MNKHHCVESLKIVVQPRIEVDIYDPRSGPRKHEAFNPIMVELHGYEFCIVLWSTQVWKLFGPHHERWQSGLSGPLNKRWKKTGSAAVTGLCIDYEKLSKTNLNLFTKHGRKNNWYKIAMNVLGGMKAPHEARRKVWPKVVRISLNNWLKLVPATVISRPACAAPIWGFCRSAHRRRRGKWQSFLERAWLHKMESISWLLLVSNNFHSPPISFSCKPGFWFQAFLSPCDLSFILRSGPGGSLFDWIKYTKIRRHSLEERSYSINKYRVGYSREINTVCMLQMRRSHDRHVKPISTFCTSTPGVSILEDTKTTGELPIAHQYRHCCGWE